MAKEVRTKGWEVAHEVERTKSSVMERLIPDKKQLMAGFYGILPLAGVFLIGCWLAGNPFESTKRLASPIVEARGWMSTNEWAIVWSVVLIAMFFEFMDATAGMGFRTAITPLLLVIGFDPKQIVPVVGRRFFISNGVSQFWPAWGALHPCWASWGRSRG